MKLIRWKGLKSWSKLLEMLETLELDREIDSFRNFKRSLEIQWRNLSEGSNTSQNSTIQRETYLMNFRNEVENFITQYLCSQPAYANLYLPEGRQSFVVNCAEKVTKEEIDAFQKSGRNWADLRLTSIMKHWITEYIEKKLEYVAMRRI